MAATAILSLNFTGSPALATATLTDPIPAADPSGLTDANHATAQAQCDLAAAAADTDGSSPDSNIFTAEVVEGAPVLKSGPTEVGSEADRTLTSPKTPGTNATFTPAHKDILGDPFRNGGSVNMFGIQESVGGFYSTSQYDFTAQFSTTYTIPYTCTISEAVFHPAVHHDQVGHWVVAPDFHGNEEAMTQNCNAFNISLPGGPNNAISDTNQANCLYIPDTPASDDPPFHDDPIVVATGVPGGSFDQTQTDTLAAHENNGAGYFDSATVIIGQVVVCISPSKNGTKLPGAWTAQNGYTGSKCTTTWYNGGATAGVPNLNDGSHNFVTVPVV
jgi:hypothetical protein